MALQPVVSSMLIDFDEPTTTPDEKAYQKQVYSAIKLNMNDLENYEVIDKFTFCLKCKQVLTDKDKGYVFDFEEVQSNPAEFGKQSVQQLKKSRFTKVLWKCSFCFHNNIVNNTDLRFAKNRTRVIEREKNVEKKDPIILIVFDVSGSMQESIEDSSGKNANWQHLEKIKETKIYKKIVADEQKELKQIIKAQCPNGQLPNDSKFKYVDHLKKNKLLMGLTEYLLEKTNMGKKSSFNQQPNKKINEFCRSSDIGSNKSNESKNKTIGFMFFNSNVLLHIDEEKSRKIMLVDSNQEYKCKLQGYEREIVNFDSFQTLFEVGQKLGDGFTNKITNFDFQSLDFRSMQNYTQGQTALGPAIVTALGVVSKHGQGSSILVVTDGIGNKGIFDETQHWDEGYKLLKIRLQKLKCFMTILQFRRGNNKMKQETLTGLDKFCQRYNDSVVKKINVIINQNQKSSNQHASNSLDEIQKKMKTGIDRDNCKFANQVNIKCQHPLVSYEKSKNDLQNKLFNLKQAVHIVPEYLEKKLTPKDYLHHFMTQIVIRYEDTKTGQQCVFMSYIIQKFIKYSKMKPKDLKSLDNENTFINIIQYLHNEEQQLSLDNLPLGIIRETFRKTICRSSVAQKTFRFPNKQIMQDEKSYEWMQNMKKFEDETVLYQQLKMSPQKAKKPIQIQKKLLNTSPSISQQIKQVDQKTPTSPIEEQNFDQYEEYEEQYISL